MYMQKHRYYSKTNYSENLPAIEHAGENDIWLYV
jgi:hypothetical protein